MKSFIGRGFYFQLLYTHTSDDITCSVYPGRVEAEEGFTGGRR